MKKLLVVFMVLAFAVPAMADDILDVSGSMRVEKFNLTNKGFSKSDVADQDFWDQRLRLQMKFNPADGAQVVLRTDITEEKWGRFPDRPGIGDSLDSEALDKLASSPPSSINAARATIRSTSNAILMIDRAYLNVDKGMVNIKGGLNAWNLGHLIAYNNQGQGLQVTVKTPLTITLGLTKESENGYLADTKETQPAPDGKLDGVEDSRDTDSYWVNLGYKMDEMAFDLYYAAVIDSRKDRYEPSVIGAAFTGMIGPVNLKAELDVFGGNSGVSGEDLFGTQLWADASMKMSDMLTIGSQFVYAAGTNDSDKTQITNVNYFGDHDVIEDHIPTMGTGNHADPGNGLVFDVGGGNHQGAIGIAPYVIFKAMDDLSIAAKIFYNTKAADGAVEADRIDSWLFYAIGASWAFAPNTTFEVAYSANSVNESNKFVGDKPETQSTIGAVLTVKF